LTLILFAGFYSSYLNRVELVKAERQACRDDIRDRSSDILVRATQAWGTQRVADDPLQPLRTRKARSVEAREDRESVRDRLTRIDDVSLVRILSEANHPDVRALILHLDADRRLDCNLEHPPATLVKV
jgi:hypothetical protein